MPTQFVCSYRQENLEEMKIFDKKSLIYKLSEKDRKISYKVTQFEREWSLLQVITFFMNQKSQSLLKDRAFFLIVVSKILRLSSTCLILKLALKGLPICSMCLSSGLNSAKFSFLSPLLKFQSSVAIEAEEYLTKFISSFLFYSFGFFYETTLSMGFARLMLSKESLSILQECFYFIYWFQVLAGSRQLKFQMVSNFSQPSQLYSLRMLQKFELLSPSFLNFMIFLLVPLVQDNFLKISTYQEQSQSILSEYLKLVDVILNRSSFIQAYDTFQFCFATVPSDKILFLQWLFLRSLSFFILVNRVLELNLFGDYESAGCLTVFVNYSLWG